MDAEPQAPQNPGARRSPTLPTAARRRINCARRQVRSAVWPVRDIDFVLASAMALLACPVDVADPRLELVADVDALSFDEEDARWVSLHAFAGYPDQDDDGENVGRRPSVTRDPRYRQALRSVELRQIMWERAQ